VKKVRIFFEPLGRGDSERLPVLIALVKIQPFVTVAPLASLCPDGRSVPASLAEESPMPRKVIATFALITTLFDGCTTTPHCHDGDLIAEYPANKGAEVKMAPHQGTYALYRRADLPESVPAQAAAPVGLRALYSLPAQAAVGFEKGEDGQLFAVVGEEKIPLPPGRYCWHATPEAPLPGGQRVVGFLTKAGKAGTEIVVGVVILAVCAGVVVLYLMCAGNSGSSSPLAH
jgi:hypothetical protein